MNGYRLSKLKCFILEKDTYNYSAYDPGMGHINLVTDYVRRLFKFRFNFVCIFAQRSKIVTKLLFI